MGDTKAAADCGEFSGINRINSRAERVKIYQKGSADKYNFRKKIF